MAEMIVEMNGTVLLEYFGSHEGMVEDFFL